MTHVAPQSLRAAPRGCHKAQPAELNELVSTAAPLPRAGSIRGLPVLPGKIPGSVFMEQG